MRFYLVCAVMVATLFGGYRYSSFYGRLNQLRRTVLDRPLTAADCDPRHVAAERAAWRQFESDYSFLFDSAS